MIIQINLHEIPFVCNFFVSDLVKLNKFSAAEFTVFKFFGFLFVVLLVGSFQFFLFVLNNIINFYIYQG